MQTQLLHFDKEFSIGPAYYCSCSWSQFHFPMCQLRCSSRLRIISYITSSLHSVLSCTSNNIESYAKDWNMNATVRQEAKKQLVPVPGPPKQFEFLIQKSCVIKCLRESGIYLFLRNFLPTTRYITGLPLLAKHHFFESYRSNSSRLPNMEQTHSYHWLLSWKNVLVS